MTVLVSGGFNYSAFSLSLLYISVMFLKFNQFLYKAEVVQRTLKVGVRQTRGRRCPTPGQQSLSARDELGAIVASLLPPSALYLGLRLLCGLSGSGRGHRGQVKCDPKWAHAPSCCPHGTALRGSGCWGPAEVVSRGRARPTYLCGRISLSSPGWKWSLGCVSVVRSVYQTGPRIGRVGTVRWEEARSSLLLPWGPTSRVWLLQDQLQRLQGPRKNKNRDVCTKIVKNVRKGTAEDHLVWASSKHGALCDCAGPIPTKPACATTSTRPPARQGLDPSLILLCPWESLATSPGLSFPRCEMGLTTALSWDSKWDTTCKTAWHFGKWWKMVALSCLKSLPLLASCLHLSNEGDFTSLVTKSLISKDHNFSKDILCVQQCSVFMHGTPSALHVREGMLTLVKQTFSCPLEWGLKKSLPGMMCKAAGKPARRAY